MNKAITYYSITVSSFIMAFIFATATSYTQLGIAVILFPVFAFFILKILPRKQTSLQSTTNIAPVVNASMLEMPLQATSQQSVTPPPTPANENIIEDIDKRAFLKIIGATSITLLLTSMFSRRADSLLFGKSSTEEPMVLRDSSGKTVNPVERQPTDGYQITEIDDSATAYFGFTNKEGAWFIIKQDAQTGSFRYAKGDANLGSYWTNRENLQYNYYNEVFN